MDDENFCVWVFSHEGKLEKINHEGMCDDLAGWCGVPGHRDGVRVETSGNVIVITKNIGDPDSPKNKIWIAPAGVVPTI